MSGIQQILQQAWSQFAGQCAAVLPNLIASLLFLVVGFGATWLAGLVARLVLRRSSMERKATRMGLTTWLERAGIFSVTALVARIVQGVFALATAGLMLHALDQSLAADLTRRFLLYLPHLAVGIGILVAGGVASRLAERRVLIGAVNRGFRPARLLSTLTRAGILVVATAVALGHLGIGGNTVPLVLVILTAGVTLTVALAVGLGSRAAVGRWIDDWMVEPDPAPRDDLEHW